MKKILLMIGLIVIVTLAFVPTVSADDYLITNYTLAYNTYSTINDDYLKVNNISYFGPSIRKIEITNTAIVYAVFNGTHSWSVDLMFAGSGTGAGADQYKIGSGTVTTYRTPSYDADYFTPSTVTITIDEMSGYNNTGKAWIHLKNTTPMPTAITSYLSYSDAPTLSPDFGVSLGAANNAGRLFGNYHLYGDLNYGNFTINVKSNSTGLNIPRADVTYFAQDFSITGKTDLEGNVHFDLLGSWPAPINLTVSKAGYNTSVTAPFPGTFSGDETINVVLNDVVSVTGTAEVYVDIVDDYTNGAITGATVGIQNTTAELDAWRYATFSESTIKFNSTGTGPYYPLHVGQQVVFAGYKTGEYSANNTGLYTIPSTISHIVLPLSRIAATSGNYFFPVMVTDSTTGNAISGSWLNTEETGSGNWYNRSSPIGQFNLTGKGSSASVPLVLGDYLTVFGNATGYLDGGFYLQVSEDGNGVQQYVNLAPSGYQPKTGEFTLIILVYDNDSSAAISGASVAMKTGNSSTTKTTGSSGSVTFKNLTAGDLHQMTVIKTGYSTVTKNIMGGSGDIVYEDVPMNPAGVAPTTTTTSAGIGGGTVSSDELNQKGASGLAELMDLVITGKLWLLGLLLLMIYAARKAFMG